MSGRNPNAPLSPPPQSRRGKVTVLVSWDAGKLTSDNVYKVLSKALGHRACHGSAQQTPARKKPDKTKARQNPLKIPYRQKPAEAALWQPGHGVQASDRVLWCEADSALKLNLNVAGQEPSVPLTEPLVLPPRARTGICSFRLPAWPLEPLIFFSGQKNAPVLRSPHSVNF